MKFIDCCATFAVIFAFFRYDLCLGTNMPVFGFSGFPNLPEVRRHKIDLHDKGNRQRTTREARNDGFEERTKCSVGDNQPPNRVDTTSRLSSLRNKMVDQSLDALMVPSEDEHQNEYVATSDKRREFVTGFSGSAGLAVVTRGENVLWTDSRYTLQANQQLDCSWKLFIHGADALTPAEWLKGHLQNGSGVGADVRIFSAEDWESTANALNDSGVALVDSRIVDEVWENYDRPEQIKEMVFIHDLEFAGIPWEKKIQEIREKLREKMADLFVVSALDEVAWLLNLRGNSIPFTPVFRSYLILESRDKSPVHLFMQNTTTVSDSVRRHLNLDSCSAADTCVKIHPYEAIKPFLEEISKREDVRKVLVSKSHPYFRGVSYFIYSAVPKAKREVAPSPVMLRKSRKEGPEGDSMKEAQIKDSVALIEFFAFLEQEISNGGVWDEISVLAPLRKFRSAQSHFRSESFAPISAFGSNGAVVHYLPSNETKKQITDQSLYLLDSGGQYLDGTTDVTRTFQYGSPTAFQKEAYTRVLQGAIDLATLIFPPGVKDIFIDIIARRPLYESGLNYGHGTGHGVGLFLNIHEGPTLLGMHERTSSVVELGQFFSDEPGYYKAGDFGIRLESILRVVTHPTLKTEKGEAMLQFEVVTLVPFEPKLTDPSLLSMKQCLFLNAYHKRVEEVVGERLRVNDRKDAISWLKKKTKPIECLHAVTGSANAHKRHSLLAVLLLIALQCRFTTT